MADERPDIGAKQNSGMRVTNDLAVAETLRSVSTCKEEAEAKANKSEEKISVFWRVFGGTLLSIGALVVMTVYSGLSGSIGDLRRDFNSEIEKRAEFARKEDLNRTATAQWAAIKDVQTSAGQLSTVGDRVKVLDQQMERNHKFSEEDRKDLRQKVDDQRKATHDFKVEMFRQVEDQRKAQDNKFQEVQRKLDDQRKGFDDERKELQRKIDDQRKLFDDERKELLTRVQTLSERLAAVEARSLIQAPNKGQPSGN